MARENDTPIEQVPEVDALEQTKARIKAFMESNPELFRYWNELADEYNERLQAAEKATRAREISCGDFALYQRQTKYDADFMYERFGREKFLELGGKLETVQKRDVNKKMVDLNIQSGKINAEDAAAIKKSSPRYKKPDPILVPKL